MSNVLRGLDPQQRTKDYPGRETEAGVRITFTFLSLDQVDVPVFDGFAPDPLGSRLYFMSGRLSPLQALLRGPECLRLSLPVFVTCLSGLPRL